MRFRLFMLFYCTGLLLRAQSPQYLHYGLADGLPSNLVYCIEQDRNGMIWLGTDNGLARFDGKNFRNFQVQDGIPDPEVLNLKLDLEGRLWVSCFRKSACYYKNGVFKNEKTDTVLANIQFSSAINDLFIDTASGVWFTGTDNNIYHLYENRVRHFESNHPVHKIAKIGKDMFALSRACLSLFNPENGEGDTLVNLYSKIDTSYRLEGIGVSGNRILYATSRGLWLFEWDESRMRLIDHQDYPGGSVFVDKQKRFWVGTNDVGAICFDNHARNLTNPRYYLQDQKITNLFQDKEGSIWFGTTGNGIFILPQHYSLKYTKIEGLPLNNITALCRLPNGSLMTGDEEGNIAWVSGNKVLSNILLPNRSYNRVRHIAVLDADRQLITADYGIFIRNTTGKIQHISQRASAKAALIQGDTLWSGNSTMFEATDIRARQSYIITRRRVTALEQSPDGMIWMAGVDGLFSKRDNFTNNYAQHFNTLNCRVTDLLLRSPDQLLLGTSDAGLLSASIQDGKVTGVQRLSFGVRSAPPQIRSIYQDENKTIWLATPEGIYWLSVDHRTGRISTSQGLVDNDVNALVVAKDTLWAATRYGLSIVPLRPQSNQIDFDISFTTIRYRQHRRLHHRDLYGESHQPVEIPLPIQASMVEIDIAAMEYTGVGIEYEVEERQGLLPWYQWTFGNLVNWSFWRNQKPHQIMRINEPNLNLGANPQPGVYQFRVRAFAENGVRSRNEIELSVIIPPHWYEMLWFWLFLIGCTAFAAWRYFRTSMRVKMLDSAVANLQLQALQAQINPHFLGNSVNAIQQFFYPPNPAKASEYVGILTDLLRKTMSFSEHHFIPFHEELSYDQEYLQLIELRYGEQFQFTISGAETIPPDTPFPGMLLQPLLENATIHGLAQEGPSVLNLEFNLQNDWLVCRILDNGIGIDATKNKPRPLERKSQGLELLYKKIQTLNILYRLQLTLDIRDRSAEREQAQGTCAELRYRLSGLPKEKELTASLPTLEAS